jgi:hypothetical protein
VRPSPIRNPETQVRSARAGTEVVFRAGLDQPGEGAGSVASDPLGEIGRGDRDAARTGRRANAFLSIFAGTRSTSSRRTPCSPKGGLRAPFTARRTAVTRSRLELTRSQIRAFRRHVGALDERLPPGSRSLRPAAWAGLQDSMPRAALLSIHARVRGNGRPPGKTRRSSSSGDRGSVRTSCRHGTAPSSRSGGSRTTLAAGGPQDSGRSGRCRPWSWT